MTMGIVSLRSSSKGNAFLVRIADDHKRKVSILLDAGISVANFEETCLQLKIKPWIDSIIVTHHHGDHSGFAFDLADKFKAKLHMTNQCFSTLSKKPSSEEKARAFSRENLRLFEAGETILLDLCSVRTFPVPHDAHNVGLVIENEENSLGYLLDVGHTNTRILQAISQVNILVIEANYDSSLLPLATYPTQVAARIGGPYGHLSNEQASVVVESLNSGSSGSGVSLIMAAHLSRKTNTAKLAYESLHRGWRRGRGRNPMPLIYITPSLEPSPIFTLTHSGLISRNSGNNVPKEREKVCQGG